jgi:hypothetical protein
MKKKSHHSYILNNQILEHVPSNPYLGLQIAEDIKWKEHINNTCKKASSTLGFLRRNLQHCPRGYRVVSPRLPVCLWSICPGK